jgi:uncharacterized protein
MKDRFIHLAMKQAKLVMISIVIITSIIVFFAYQRIAASPDTVIDTDPENMLDKSEEVRQFHNLTKDKFELFDVVAMGVYYPEENGVYHPEILSAINSITNELIELEFKNYVINKNSDTVLIDLKFNKEQNGEVLHEQGVIFKDIIAPNQVDDINGTSGTLEISRLLKKDPSNLLESLILKDRIDSNPLYRNKLASLDGKIIGIYIPIKSKTISYKLSEVLRVLAEKYLSNISINNEAFFGSEENPKGKFMIAGIPVAQDTFGIFMFDQMGVSAPLAGLVIFILLFIFFRDFKVITGPMILAIVSITWTMGLLIGMGYTLHIMSSMIPIFLFPIAVLDSIHVISSIHKKFGHKKDLHGSIEKTISELFSPMLFTSLTTTIGFASLMLTPIPPVQVFGAFVAVGVLSAWLLSITFLPAYINLLGDKSLKDFGHKKDSEHGLIGKISHKLENLSQNYHKNIMVISAALFVIAIYGINKIEINDNPVNWFKDGHPLREASELMNNHLSGTYMTNIVFEKDENFKAEGEELPFAELSDKTIKTLNGNSSSYVLWGSLNDGSLFQSRLNAKDIGKNYQNKLSDKYEIRKLNVFNEDRYEEMIFREFYHIESNELISDLSFNNEERIYIFKYKSKSYYTEFSEEELREIFFQELLSGHNGLDYNEVFKSPKLLKYMESVQRIAEDDKKIVGATSSINDIIKKVSAELRNGKDSFYKIPDTKNEVAQYLFLAQGGESPEDMFKFITRDYSSAHLWLHMSSGENKDMEKVINRVEKYTSENPLPDGIKVNWAGLNYINKVWQDKMVGGMANSLASSYVVVLIMVILLFRSVAWGVIAMIPITLTISLIYALIGYFGKAYDMPIAVLSSLTLGLSIDFGIHFIGRARDIFNKKKDYLETIKEVFGEPVTAMLQNTIVISVGFVPLLFSDLLPYFTVGVFFLLIMLISGFATLLILPAISKFANKRLFPKTLEKQ